MKLIKIPKGNLLLAFSGGVDSVVLLHLLLLRTKNIVLAHINHSMRGRASDRDEKFCREIAKKCGLEIRIMKLEHKPKNEEKAREERYKYLFKLMKEVGAKYIALAQHKSDQIETLLLQLIRGTYSFSPEGKWRPLLSFTKEEIYSYAKLHKLKWREDESNKDNKYSRNRVRNIIIPQIKEINSSFEDTLLRFANMVGENADFVAYAATEFIENKLKVLGIDRKEFLSQSPPVQRMIIKILKPDLYSKNIDEILIMIEKGIGKKEKHGVRLVKGKIVFPGK